MGYEVSSERLEAIAAAMGSGADSLDQVARALPDAVDAGFSSDVANAALARVGKAALALAHQGDVMASNIDTAKGAYLAMEEDAHDQVQTTAEALEDRRDRRGPLEQAAPEQAAEQDQYRPKPIPAEPGRTPEPPSAPGNG